jgi:excinuclease ABC subunit A
VPAVDAIDGLPPAVALQQQRGAPSTRSSVGSVTTLGSLLRMLYSRAGNYPPKQAMLYAEDFSPNTPQGACPTCHGLGLVYEVTEQTMVPDPSLSIRERAIAAWPPAWHGQNLRDILVTLGYDVDRPWRELPKRQRDWILFTQEQPQVPVYAGFTPAETKDALRRKLEPSYLGTYMGARKYVLHTFATTQSAMMKRRVARFMRGAPCKACHGKRLKPEALSVRFAGLDIAELSHLPLAEMARVLLPASVGRFDAAESPSGTWDPAAARRASDRRVAAGGSAHAGAPDVRRTPNLSEEKRRAAQRITHDVVERIAALTDLGLGYLSIDRSTPTLSAGELQRLRLATQLRSNLFGVVYVMDEPSAGLHPADGEALIRSLQHLKHIGNSVFVVEHDLDLMRQADWLVDVGPNAGTNGGEVLYSGPPAGLKSVSRSKTSRFLFDGSRTERQAGAKREAGGWLRLEGITRNNLVALNVEFPLGVLTSVTGVSGSGKSTLVSQVLVELVSAVLGHELPAVEADDGAPDELRSTQEHAGRLSGRVDDVKRLVLVDQRPIGRTPRSNLATYTGLFDHVRKLFAATPRARSRRYDAGRFSFNVAKGRCVTCEGEGFVSVELLFMPSVYAPCPTCHGARYDDATLQVRWRDRNIADVLGMTVDEAAQFFADQPPLQLALELLQRIGLGYLRLGQPATELSGGEAQRIKLATELQRARRAGTLYVLDEPTTGLHPADVDRLMAQLHALVDAGSTVVVVEHDMRVVADSDWIIDLGPGAGAEGGRIVAAGTPDSVASVPASRTAPYLRSQLSGRQAGP